MLWILSKIYCFINLFACFSQFTAIQIHFTLFLTSFHSNVWCICRLVNFYTSTSRAAVWNRFAFCLNICKIQPPHQLMFLQQRNNPFYYKFLMCFNVTVSVRTPMLICFIHTRLVFLCVFDIIVILEHPVVSNFQGSFCVYVVKIKYLEIVLHFNCSIHYVHSTGWQQNFSCLPQSTTLLDWCFNLNLCLP